MAEREGFEPSVRGYRTLAFQASPFDHSGISPILFRVLTLFPISIGITKYFPVFCPPGLRCAKFKIVPDNFVEPSVRGYRTLAFQASPFDHSGISPILFRVLTLFPISIGITKYFPVFCPSGLRCLKFISLLAILAVPA